MLVNQFQTKEKGPCYLFQYCGSLQAVLCRDLYISMTKHSTCSTILILFGIRLLTTDPRSFVDGSRAKDTFVGKDCKSLSVKRSLGKLPKCFLSVKVNLLNAS